VSNTLTDQSSIIKFVAQNWSLGEIPGSAANIAGSLDGMFNFTPGAPKTPKLFLSPTTGQPKYPILGTISPTHGPVSGGTAVTVKGVNFSTNPGATVVRFGGRTSPSVTCSSTTTCVAVTPGSAVAAPVKVSVIVKGVKAVDYAPPFTYQT
jgi:phospholipase C